MGKFYGQSRKKYVLTVMFLSLISFSFDAFAGAKTKSEVLSYLNSLPSQSSKKVLSGQFIGWCGEVDPGMFDRIHTASGHYPAVMSGNYARFGECSSSSGLISGVNSNLKTHWAAGGIVEVGWHADNPVTMSWDHGTAVNLVDLVTNGTSTNTNFKALLDEVAVGLQDLKDANIVVIFRPFLEMNGDWFWWGDQDGTQFKNAWIYMHNYLVNTKGLTNLLWAFAYDSSGGTAASTYYPGSAYVDIVGMDYYPSSQTGRMSSLSNYSYLTGLGKPFAFTEFGQCNYLGCPSPQNNAYQIDDIKTYAPSAVYWSNWNETWSMDYNSNVSALMNDPSVVTREDSPSQSAAVSSQSKKPSPPSGFTIK